jgi:hypothetical protein
METDKRDPSKDLYVIAEILPWWAKNALGVTHSGILVGPCPTGAGDVHKAAKAALKLAKENAALFAVDLKFSGLIVGGGNLIAWAETRKARLLLDAAPFEQPDPNVYFRSI